MREIQITKFDEGQRLDKYFFKYFNKASKSFTYKMIRKKRIKCSKKRVEESYILKEGDVLQLYLSDETIAEFREEKRFIKVEQTFTVIYEDKNILIANKPQGLLAQKSEPDDISLVDEVISYLIRTRAYDPKEMKGFVPGICNRLDRNTSGLVLVGKNQKASQSLNKLIAERKIHKFYTCLVGGSVKKAMTLEGVLEKDQQDNKVKIKGQGESGKEIKTRILPQKEFLKSNRKDVMTQLEVELITGKTHQIRAHLASIGHPIIGDSKYGSKKINDFFKRKMRLNYHLLHAYRIVFNETDDYLSYLEGKEFRAPTPRIFDKTINAFTN